MVRLVDYFMRRGGIFKTTDRSETVNREGSYVLYWTTMQCSWEVGKRGEPNR